MENVFSFSYFKKNIKNSVENVINDPFKFKIRILKVIQQQFKEIVHAFEILDLYAWRKSGSGNMMFGNLVTFKIISKGKS